MNPPSYTYLNFIPGMLIYVVLLAVALGMFGYTCYRRFAIFGLTPFVNRFDRIPQRIVHVVLIAIGQKKLFKDSVAGPMHALIFWGFCAVALNTMHLVVRGFFPAFHFPFFGPGFIGVGYECFKDMAEVIVAVMVLFAMYRRQIQKVPRLTQSNEALLILGLIFILMVTDFFIVGADHLMYTRGYPNMPHHAVGFMGLATAGLLDGAGLGAGALVNIHQFNWWLHMFALFLMLNLLPLGKHFHIITSLPNVFFANLDAPGRFERIDFEAAFSDEGDDEVSFGVEKVEQYNWKQVMDFYSCTECGRCTEVCPAAISGKTLSPKHFNIFVRDHLYEKNDILLKLLADKNAPKLEKADGSTVDNKSVYSEEEQALIDKEVVTAWDENYGKYHGLTEEEVAQQRPGYEALWACTTCRNCEEACPLEIQFVERFVELRRNFVLMEKGFPQELVRTFKGMEVNSNPWNMDAAQRDGWTKGVDFEVPRMAEKADEVEYLFFVGCAGSFDERNMKITQATARILNKAGVKFGILGNEETCTGDSARRAGNEYLADEMSQGLVGKLNEYKVRKVITNCPHCLNSLKNEFPDYGGNYEVTHATQLVNDLIKSGRIKPTKSQNLQMAYHDSCYLGRYNDVYDAPREILQALPGVTPVEMKEFKREKSLCCGAGGARMWQEEEPSQRVNAIRVDHALEALGGKNESAGCASNCPFCMTMLEDGAKMKNIDETFVTKDIMELVDGSLEG